MTTRSFSLLALASLLSGCAIDSGAGFATLERATFDAQLEPSAARDLGDGALMTDLGYRVQLNRATLRVERIELQEQTTDSSSRFDPSRPPPGYSSCHGDHCHRDDDGALISYEEIELELAGGNSAFETLTTMRFSADSSLLEAKAVAATSFEPSAELRRGTLRRAVGVFERLVIEGSVEGGPDGSGLGDDVVELSIRLPASIELTATFDPLVLGRDGSQRLRLGTWLDVDGTLFDGIDFGELAQSGSVTLDDPDSEAAESLLSALANGHFSASFGEKPVVEHVDHDDDDDHDDHDHEDEDDHDHDDHDHDAGHHDDHDHDAGHHDDHDHDAGHHDDHDHDAGHHDDAGH